MEKPPIIEKAKETLSSVSRKIGGFIFTQLERHDDALDVYGSDDTEHDFAEDEHLVTPEELAELEDHIIRSAN